MTLTPTMVWAKEHRHRPHPSLKKAIKEAKPLIERGLWALAVAGAFDAGIAAERRGELP